MRWLADAEKGAWDVSEGWHGESVRGNLSRVMEGFLLGRNGLPRCPVRGWETESQSPFFQPSAWSSASPEGSRLNSPELESSAGPLKSNAPFSHPRIWQVKLGLKQMLNWCVERDGQQQYSQCPDAGGGLWVCGTANRD